MLKGVQGQDTWVQALKQMLRPNQVGQALPGSEKGVNEKQKPAQRKEETSQTK